MSQEAHQHTVPITIDGRRFEMEQGRHLTAGDLLRLAGLDPAGYELAEVLGHGEVRDFRNDEVVDVRPDEKFVSVRQVAPVA
ncbi:MAG: multiubiquitin domain-containing protein [Trebonia sp.]